MEGRGVFGIGTSRSWRSNGDVFFLVLSLLGAIFPFLYENFVLLGAVFKMGVLQ